MHLNYVNDKYNMQMYFFITGSMNTTKGIMDLPASAEATSECILFFDHLFDSFNANEKKRDIMYYYKFK